jgi:glycine dehydrogenase subunit 2
MLTNPNTLGLFEQNVLEVIEMVHDCGGLVYGDGANLNACWVLPARATWELMSCTSTCIKPSPPRMAAADLAQARWALSNTWSNSCQARSSILSKKATKISAALRFLHARQSIGRVKSFFGHFGMMVRAIPTSP